jgi:catechol-2,3-dioxygenase
MNLASPGAHYAAQVSPARIAHYVLKTARYEETVEWYKTVLMAHATFANDKLTFLRFDDEHHRIVVGYVPTAKPSSEDAEGVDHIAFTYATLGDLVHTYERLAGVGIRPVRCINHGPTTSLYYQDPTGLGVELMVDNFAKAEDCINWFFTENFAKNPVGLAFDPEVLAEKFHAGVPDEVLLAQGSLPALRDARQEHYQKQ